jgi:group I intron endonuclease
MKKCGIYMITSPSGKIYIGQSVDIKRRVKRYKYFGAIEQPYLHRSFIKYGFDNHKIEILAECQRDELNLKEVELIKKHNSFGSIIGMNLTSGGMQNWKISEETRNKMKSRIRNPHSEQTKNKIRMAHLGKKKNYKNPRKGVKLSSETKQKIRDNHSHSKPMLGKKHTEKTKLKISKSNKGRVAYNRRPIIDTHTNIIYSCKKDAANALGIKERTLKAKLLGKIKNNTTLRYA